MKRYERERRTAIVILAALMLAACTNTASGAPEDGATDTAPKETTSETASETTAADTTAITTEVTYDSSGVMGTPVRIEEDMQVDTAEMVYTGTVIPSDVPVTEWSAAYRQTMMGLVEDGDEYSIPDMCSLYDMTDDGIPELIISVGEWHMAQTEIYSYHDGEVHHLYWVPTGEGAEPYYGFGVYGEVGWSPMWKEIRTGDMHMGYDSTSSSHIEGDEVKEDLTAYCYEGVDWSEEVDPDADEQSFITEYSVNGKDCTKEEYDDAMKKNRAYDVITLGRDYLVPEELLIKKYGDEYMTEREYMLKGHRSYDEIVVIMEEGYKVPYERVKLISAEEDVKDPDGGAIERAYMFSVDDVPYLFNVIDGQGRFSAAHRSNFCEVPFKGEYRSASVVCYFDELFFISYDRSEKSVHEFVYSIDRNEVIMDSDFEGEYGFSGDFDEYLQCKDLLYLGW